MIAGVPVNGASGHILLSTLYIKNFLNSLISKLLVVIPHKDLHLIKKSLSLHRRPQMIHYKICLFPCIVQTGIPDLFSIWFVLDSGKRNIQSSFFILSYKFNEIFSPKICIFFLELAPVIHLAVGFHKRWR